MLAIVRGSLDLLVLKPASWKPMHGVEIIAWLESASGGRLEFDDSAVYQALYRMEKAGYLEAEWGVSDNNRRARYYSITPSGRRHLQHETKQLLQSTRLLGDLLTTSALGEKA